MPRIFKVLGMTILLALGLTALSCLMAAFVWFINSLWGPHGVVYVITIPLLFFVLYSIANEII